MGQLSTALFTAVLSVTVIGLSFFVMPPWVRRGGGHNVLQAGPWEG